MRYLFRTELIGNGNSPQEAWDEAVEALSEDPGGFPDDYEVDEDDDEE